MPWFKLDDEPNDYLLGVIEQYMFFIRKSITTSNIEFYHARCIEMSKYNVSEAASSDALDAILASSEASLAHLLFHADYGVKPPKPFSETVEFCPMIIRQPGSDGLCIIDVPDLGIHHKSEGLVQDVLYDIGTKISEMEIDSLSYSFDEYVAMLKVGDILAINLYDVQ